MSGLPWFAAEEWYSCVILMVHSVILSKKKKCVWVFFLKKLTLHKNVNERIFILRLSDKLVAYSAWSGSPPMDCTMFTSYDQPSNVLLLIITIIILCYCMYVIHQAFETEWITHEIVLKDDQWGSCSQTNCIIQETVCHYITPKLLILCLYNSLTSV